MVMIKENLITLLNNKTAKIAIVGLGYVGLPLALRFMEENYHVVGVDINESKVAVINKGESPIKHISSQKIQAMLHNGLFSVTTDFARIKEVDAIIICVPTPLNEYREPDLSCVMNSVNALLPYMHNGQVISLESTVYPGATEKIIGSKLIKAGFSIGENIFLVYSPEREDPGNESYNTKNTPKICSGATKNCLEVGLVLYKNIIDSVIAARSIKVAEMAKLLENISRAINIAAINEMKIISDKIGVDIYDVIDVAKTKPFGFVPYYPGPGVGGHCIPIDPIYLSWKVRKYGLHAHFIELASEINASMPQWSVQKIIRTLTEHKKTLHGSKMLVLGVAYKKNIDDVRESPVINIIELLRDYGISIDYCDPYVPKINLSSSGDDVVTMTSIPFKEANIAKYDSVVIATNHDVFDYDLIAQKAKLIFDARGVYRSKDRDNVVTI